MSKHDAHQMINQLHGETDTTAVKAIYDQWATQYDNDLEQLGYLGPKTGAQVLRTHLPNQKALILDAGCGTGLAGHWLHRYGYLNLHGTDYSEGMLATAAKRGIYQKLFRADFQQALAVETAVYDALICIGVMGPRVRTSILEEFARIVKPDGLLCVSMRVAWYEAHGAKQQIEMMIDNKIVEAVTIEQKPYMDGQQAEALYAVLRVSSKRHTEA
ncbi:MAG: class I SAM-dependent methyltransferase [Chloroflexota bacterium]